MDKAKLCLVGSGGGHFKHLMYIKPLWTNYDRFFVSFDREEVRSAIEGERFYPCYYPTNRSLIALIKNFFVAFKVLRKEKPDVIISAGAAVAVPFFYIGKLMGIKTVFIEIFDRFDEATTTGKLCYPVSDVFIVQWEEMKKYYPKAKCLGSIF